jgi:hypothetical protein
MRGFFAPINGISCYNCSQNVFKGDIMVKICVLSSHICLDRQTLPLTLKILNCFTPCYLTLLWCKIVSSLSSHTLLLVTFKSVYQKISLLHLWLYRLSSLCCNVIVRVYKTTKGGLSFVCPQIALNVDFMGLSWCNYVS